MNDYSEAKHEKQAPIYAAAFAPTEPLFGPDPEPEQPKKPPPSLLDTALLGARSGLSIIPVRTDGSKIPGRADMKTTEGFSWGEYKDDPQNGYVGKRADAKQLRLWFVKTKGQTGIGVVCGSISGGLRILDFETAEVFAWWCELMERAGYAVLLDKLLRGYLERSPRGRHVFFRGIGERRHLKLAQHYERDGDGNFVPDEAGNPKIKTLIEVLGEGNYCVIAPSHGSVHETGRPYVAMRGTLGTIPLVTREEEEMCFAIARLCDEITHAPKTEQPPHPTAGQADEHLPGRQFDRHATWGSILEPYGWVKVFERHGKGFWRRPGKDRDHSATTNWNGLDLFHCFTSSTQFAQDTSYRKSSVYALLTYGEGTEAWDMAVDDFIAQGFYPGGPYDTAPTDGVTDDPTDAEPEPKPYANGHTENMDAPQEEPRVHAKATGDFAHDAREEPTEEPPPDDTEEPRVHTEEPSEEPHAKPEQPPQSQYSCPESLKMGVFKTVADRLGKWSWEVWFGTFAALSACAHKNLHCFYHSGHVYGNGYSLLVSPTGTGKELVINIVHALLHPLHYKIRDSANSGQAFVGILTNDEIGAVKGHAEYAGVPALVLSSEWSRLFRMAKIENSTLYEDMNALYMRHNDWSQARSTKSSRGGDILITNPTLSICGTTTRTLFAKVVDVTSLGSGAVNRYLILPGEAEWEEYDGQEFNAHARLPGLVSTLDECTFGKGANIKTLYSPEAWEAFRTFQRDFITPIRRNPETSAALKRVDVHQQHISAIYAWQERAQTIEVRHVEAAATVVRASCAFVQELLTEQEQTVEQSPFQASNTARELLVIEKVKANPGITRRAVGMALRRHGGFVEIGKAIDALLRMGMVVWVGGVGGDQKLKPSEN